MLIIFDMLNHLSDTKTSKSNGRRRRGEWVGVHRYIWEALQELIALLPQIPQGSVCIIGHGTGKIWYPEETPERQTLFDENARDLFGELEKTGHPFFPREEILGSMTLIESGLMKVHRYWSGKTCTAISHYADQNFWAQNLEKCESIFSSKEIIDAQKTLIMIVLFIMMAIVAAKVKTS